MNTLRLSDRVVIVTGGVRGIGRSISMVMAKEGARVTAGYSHSDDEAEKLKDWFIRHGLNGSVMKADVTNPDDVQKLVDRVYETHGRIDVLVNNAGIIRDLLLVQMETDDWDSVIGVNLRGVFLCTRAAARYMMLRKSGKIINLSSVAAEQGGKGHCNYSASKGGINSFTKSIAVELASKGITVNAIAPGVIQTEMSKKLMKRGADEVLSRIPLKRLGTPEDVAGVALFLASDDANYITGEVIHVSGGMGV